MIEKMKDNENAIFQSTGQSRLRNSLTFSFGGGIQNSAGTQTENNKFFLIDKDLYSVDG